ncbi:MFS transporter [Nocardia carnea]|uniref:MFS transporter n=1 Tax=Nocardia carnea TaxID=37328 RepID=UPI002455418E|nr:MFS transporter [Nocardia carnea]
MFAPYRWYTAASGLFLLNGLGYAALASRLPELQSAYGLSDAQLGFARTGFVVGLTATMFVAPGLVRRAAARRAAPIAAGIYLLGIGVAGAGTGLWSMVGLIAGAANALLDIGQNVIAVQLEKVRMDAAPHTRPNGLLSPMEGFQAIGGVLGAAFGTATAGRVELAPAFAVVASVGAIATVIVFVLLRTFDPGAGPAGITAATKTASSGSPLSRLRAAYPPRLRRLTVLSFSALLLEGTLMNWIAVVVVGSGGSLTAASLSLTVFAGAICVGRLGYGPVSRWADRVVAVRISGVLVLTGIATLVLFPGATSTALTLLAAATAGLGLANLHPFCTATVGHAAPAGTEEIALGRLNRIAYAGIALEGVLVAALTSSVGLDAAIGILGLLALLFVFGARQFATEPDRVAAPHG